MIDHPHIEKAPYHYESVVIKKNDYSRQQECKQKVFAVMDRLEGWCTKTKASILMDLVFMLKPTTVVEIGVFGGKSFVPMAFALKTNKKGKAYGIDPWDVVESVTDMTGANETWWSKLDHAKILKDLQERITEYNLASYIEIIQSSSENAKPIQNIDILHIDGNHSEKASLFDVKKWVPLVRKGGVIIFDDVNWPSTQDAVKWLDKNCLRVNTFKDFGSDWGIWIKS